MHGGGDARLLMCTMCGAHQQRPYACGASAFSKQVTAAGFQLKGTGWYATDFRGGSHAPAPAAESGKSADGAKHAKGAKPAEGSKTDGGSKPPESSAPASKPDAPVARAGRRGRALAHRGGALTRH